MEKDRIFLITNESVQKRGGDYNETVLRLKADF